MIKWTLFIPLAALAFILCFQVLDFIFRGRKGKYLVDNRSENRPNRQEYTFSILNLFLFGAIGFLLGQAIDAGSTNGYHGSVSGVWGFAYAVISFFLALVIHDMYFYFSHRLLHTKFVFKSIHAFHHHSHHPNSWSALSFHPVEGFVQIGIIPLLAFCLPMHENVLLLFTAYMLFITIYGHSGYEVRANRWKGFAIFNTSLHHFQHHQFVYYNFGIYLNIWDRLLKSNYPGYEDSLQDIATRTRLKRNSVKHPGHGK